MTYQVLTEKFTGPLDILLQLIEEQKLAISEISLAQVTAQFLDYIKTLQDIDPNVLADFLQTASRLLVIKSKTLLPSLEEELEEEEGPSLTEQLIQFKKFKIIAKHLQQMESQSRFSFSRETQATEHVSFYPDPGANITRLHRAMQALASSLAEITKLPKKIMREVISIADKIRDLQKFLGERLELKLSEALQKKSKTEVIVTFLAMLELVKQRILTVDQEQLFSEITIKKRTTNAT